MNNEKRAGRGANEQTEKHGHQSARLFARDRTIRNISYEKDEGGRCRRREDATDIKPANRNALHSHRERPGGQENEGVALARMAADCEPPHHEAEVDEQRDTESEGRALRPYDAV